MQFEYSPYTLPLLSAAIVSAMVVAYAWTRRSAKGALPLFVLAVFVLEWIISYSLEIMGIGLETKYFWGVMEYIGIAFVPYVWLIFSIAYSGQEGILSRRFLVLTAFIPAITVLLAWTTRWHGLVWSEYHIASQQGVFSALEVSHGPWFFVHFAYSYGALLIGAFLLVRVLFSRKGMYRGQVAAMLIAVLAPWIGNALFLTGNSPIPYLDLTPFAFTVSVAAVAWAVFGFRLVDITPLARDSVVDSMREGMIVLDMRGNVVDINNAAARMIGIPAADAIGKTAIDVFSPWSHLVERFRNVMETKDEIFVGVGEAKRRYEVRLSPLQDQQDQFVGRVIMLRALDDEVLYSRAGYNASEDTPAQPLPRLPDEEDGVEKKTASIWDILIGYFVVNIKQDIPIPSGVNPFWYRTRERIFTVGARIVSALGVIAIVFAPQKFFSTGVGLIFFVLLFIVWFLGMARTVKYELRVIGFLALMYGFALVETFNFGLSAEAFVFFLSFAIFASVLTVRRGAISAWAISIVSLSGFTGWIVYGDFIPLMKRLEGVYVPEAGLSSLLVFITSVSAITSFIVILLENLNTAWQKEAQAVNLLQQERDLLEKRVDERTHDLAEARDQAVTVSKQMQKYFLAIEQNGNTIVITDTHGTIEYVNPRFEQTTGYSIAEALGNNLRMLKSDYQSADFYKHLWQTISGGNIWRGEFLNKRKDGALYWEAATIAPLLDQTGRITNFVANKEDVTERKQAQEQLQKLSQAVEQSGNTVIILDKSGLIEYVNPKFTEVTGFSSEEALGKSPIALMNGLGTVPDFRQDPWWLTVTAGGIWRGEFHNRRKDGSMFWESATIAPVHNHRGDVINFVEIKQDITEQKILQDQLQKQNDYLSILHQVTLDLLDRREIADLLKTIVDRSAILLDAPFSELMLEKDGVLIVEAFTDNQPGLKGDRVMRGQALLSWQAFDTHLPVVLDDYSTWEHKREIYKLKELHATVDFPVLAGNRCLGILALGRSQPEYRFTAEQIETGILFARLVAIVLDNANLYDSAVQEIAERKRAEDLLLESEIRFRQIVENASDIIYRADINGNFTYANPSALKMMGYTREEEALGRHYLDLTIPEFRQKLKRFYEHQYLSKTQGTYYEFPAITADGQLIWVGQNVQLILENEQIVGFQSVARNITQLKQAQEALALSRDQALEASRFKSQLLSRVSHELRTPLGGILGYAELIQYKSFGPLTEKQDEALKNIIESTHYLTSIVSDLLDEAQIESNSLVLHNEYFAPADLCEKIRPTISALANKKGLTFSVDLAPDLPFELYGDITRLQQVITNLAGNAIKFTREGGVSINIMRPAPTYWSIEVQDSGAGIPENEWQNIFEPFRQVNNAITRENRGSGLGLAITKQLVELMEGQISLESQVGKGSLFTVTLPIIQPPGA